MNANQPPARRPQLRAVPAALLTAACAAMSAPAAIIVNIGSHALQPGQADQTLILSVENTGDDPVAVDALNFFALVGGGGPALGGDPVPAITGVDLHTGTAFDGNFTPEVDQGSADGVAQWFITTASGAVNLAPGLTRLAELTVDTTGFLAGDGPWALRLAANILGTDVGTGFVRLGVDVPVQTVDGLITLVPEPGEVALAMGLGLAGFALWRRARG